MQCCLCCESFSWFLGMIFLHWTCVWHRQSTFCSLYTLYHWTSSTLSALSDGNTPKHKQGFEWGHTHQYARVMLPAAGKCASSDSGTLLSTSKHPKGDVQVYLSVMLPSRRDLQSSRCERPVVNCLLGVLFFSFPAHNPFSVPRSWLWNLWFLMYAHAVN